MVNEGEEYLKIMAHYEPLRAHLVSLADRLGTAARDFFQLRRPGSLQQEGKVSPTTIDLLGLEIVQHALDMKVDFKDNVPASPVSGLEMIFRSYLQKQLSDYASKIGHDIVFISEESFVNRKEKLELDHPERWVVDELDGTSNAFRGHRDFATNLGYEWVQRDERIMRVGVVVTPSLGGHVYSAITGQVPKKRDTPMSTSVEKLPLEAVDLCACTFNTAKTDAEREYQLKFSHAIAELSVTAFRSRRAYGSLSVHALRIAQGRDHVYVHPRPALWDYSAVIPIIEGVGGRITDIDGKPPQHRRPLVITHGVEHDKVLEHLAKYSLSSPGA